MRDTDRVAFDDDETELTGRYISAFQYKGERHKVVSWKDMLTTLCRLIYEDSPSSMRVLCNVREWLHDNPGKDGARSQFADGCYVYSSCSTKTKMSIIRYIFSKLNIQPSELEFELYPQTEQISDTDANEI